MNGTWSKVAVIGAFVAAATTVRGQEGPPAVPLDAPAAKVSVPSGLKLLRQEVLEETQPDGTLWLRLRYVAPEMTRDNRPGMQADFETLCESEALTYEPVTRVPAAQAVISIATAPVKFGTTAPDIPQFFEAFRLEDGTCIWEAF